MEYPDASDEDAQASGLSPLRFALLCDSPSIERWQSDAILSLLDDGHAVLVAVLYTGDRRQAESTSAATARGPFRPAERECVGQITDLLSSRSLSIPSSSQSAENLEALRLDFVLYVGFGTADRRFARCARRGLWRFRFGAPQQRQTYPPGIWETIAGDRVSMAALCELPSNSDDTIVLRQCALETIAHVPNANADRLLREAASWPAHVARILARRLQLNADSAIDWATEAAPKAPGFVTYLRLVTSLLVRKLSRVPNLFLDDSWNVAIVDKPIHAFLAESGGISPVWFPNVNADTYLADPMGATRGGTQFVLCESYDFKAELGSIVRLGIDGARWLPSVTSAIASRFHSSYPYLFEFGGELYCVPESSQADDVALYEAAPRTNELRRIKTLFSESKYLDPTIFQHEGLWWLFCTDASLGEHSHLLGFYAAEPLGEWKAHPLNPLKIDVRSARPAGTPFLHQGRLYRPSQDCSRTYGGGVTINEIVCLTTTSFNEVHAASVRPIKRSKFRLGIHTLSAFGSRTLIDGKRRIFTGKGIKEKLDSVARLGARR